MNQSTGNGRRGMKVAWGRHTEMNSEAVNNGDRTMSTTWEHNGRAHQQVGNCGKARQV